MKKCHESERFLIYVLCDVIIYRECKHSRGTRSLTKNFTLGRRNSCINKKVREYLRRRENGNAVYSTMTDDATKNDYHVSGTFIGQKNV